MKSAVAQNALASDRDRLLQTVANLPGSAFLETARTDDENRRSYLFLHPMQVLSARTLQEIPGVFEEIERYLLAGCWICGFLSYEAGYHFEPAAMRGAAPLTAGDLPLAWFGVYCESVPIDGVSERDEKSDREPAHPSRESVGPIDHQIELPPGAYGRKIDRIRQYIAAGDIYQANFTLRLRQRWPWGAQKLYEKAIANQPVPYGAFINTGSAHIVSASPELFFRRHGDDIRVCPMKGTARRGRDMDEDARMAAWLAADEKNRAENVMIVDLLRNDLGRICTPGTIRTSEMFSVEKYPDLFQMISTVEGKLKPGTSWYEIFRSLFPCGSITGAPKVRAMQIIRELEAESRGIGCGAIGFLAPAGQALFSVAIRTMTLHGEMVEMRVGSGITYDSDARFEYAECLLKTAFLTRENRKFELIETLLWDGRYFLLDLHLERLQASAAYFDFKLDTDAVRGQLLHYAASLPDGLRHRVRALLAPTGTVSISSQPIVAAAATAEIVLYPQRTQSTDPFLRHKTTRRELYDTALKRARASGFEDALFLNERAEVTECAIHNIVIEKDGKLLTPALDCGLLPGVYRSYLMNGAQQAEEAVLTFDDILAADRVFLCNSVQGMRSVTRVARWP